MYSTPEISQSSFSIGRVARSSTSLALNPGMDTSTSTIGTLICGSSSRGSISTAASPSSTEVTMTSGVSLESINVRAMRPAMPSEGAFECTDCFLRQKLQAPGSREIQSSKPQTTKPKPGNRFCRFVLGDSLEFGAWDLELHFAKESPNTNRQNLLPGL